MRRSHKAAAEVAVDTAQRLIAILDRMDGEAEDEDGKDAEPSLGAPEGHASQVMWLRGGDEDREAEAPEIALPDVAVTSAARAVKLDPGPAPAEPAQIPAAIVIPLPIVPRGGRGSLCTAAAIHLFDLVAGEG